MEGNSTSHYYLYSTSHYYLYSSTCKTFASRSCDPMVCWSRNLVFKGRNVSTRKHKNDLIELEVMTVIWPLWAPHNSESTAKKGVMMLAAVIDPGYQGLIGLLLPNRDKEEKSEIQKIPWGIF